MAWVRGSAAAGVSHAQRTVDEHLQLHARHLLTDLTDLFQRQFAREDGAGQALAAPELDAGPVHRVGLHRQVDVHVREVLAHQHDQPRVGHDQRVRPHRHHRLQILDEGLQLGVVRRNVDHHVELLALGMRLVDPQRQVGVVELVVAHPQAVAWLAGIHRVGAIGEGIAHVAQGAGRGKQFGFERGGHAGYSVDARKVGDFTAIARQPQVRRRTWTIPVA